MDHAVRMILLELGREADEDNDIWRKDWRTHFILMRWTFRLNLMIPMTLIWSKNGLSELSHRAFERLGFCTM